LPRMTWRAIIEGGDCRMTAWAMLWEIQRTKGNMSVTPDQSADPQQRCCAFCHLHIHTAKRGIGGGVPNCHGLWQAR
jgi:hypothetical protein